MNQSMPIVFIVDDDTSCLRSMSRLLKASDFQVVIHNSAVEFLAELKPETRGCVITDLIMPEMDGIDLQKAMQQKPHPLPILFLTGQGDIPIAVEAMRSGAEDFLTKQASKDDLIAAVKRALARNERDWAEWERMQDLRQPFQLLSEREREVLQHVVQGKLNKQIAADLGIHERTVKLHRTSITQKLHVQSVAELTRRVQEAGFQ